MKTNFMKIEYILTSYIGRYVGRYVGSGTFTGLLRGFEEIRNWKLEILFCKVKERFVTETEIFHVRKKNFSQNKNISHKIIFPDFNFRGNPIQLHEIAPTESMPKKQKFSQNKNISHKNIFPDFNFREEFNTSLSITRETKKNINQN